MCFKRGKAQYVVLRNDMQCPYCLNADTKVVDKRDAERQSKRRRECLKCQKRFSTLESVEWSALRVIKKDGRRESFDFEKLKNVLHVIGMAYQITNGKLDVDKVTEESLTRTLKRAFRFADKNKYKSVSTPVLCTRGDYGLNPKVSLLAIINAIKETKFSSVKRIVICFESEGPKDTFDSLNEEDLK